MNFAVHFLYRKYETKIFAVKFFDRKTGKEIYARREERRNCDN